MIVQLTTIIGRKLWRQLPVHIQTTRDFREWLSRQIIDDPSSSDGNIGNLATSAATRVQSELAIRVNGRTITDRLIQEWQQNQQSVEPMINVEWQPRGRGGFIMDVIKAIIAIFRFMLFIPKFLIWIGQLIIWKFKVLIYLLNTVYIILSKDGILGLIKFIVNEIVLLPFKVLAYLAKNIINTLGRQTVYGIWGADNARDSDLAKEQANGKAGPPSDSNLADVECDGRQKCYIRPDGSVPFGVVVVTVLCPPVGVFMEYGINGWLKILVCFMLTLMMYFPGLIYALVLLYC